jgi:hypothetical protein
MKFHENLSSKFNKILRYEISWKSVQREQSCSMRTDRWMDGRTDMTKLTAVFRDFSNSPAKPCTVEIWHYNLQRDVRPVRLVTEMHVVCGSAVRCPLSDI